MSDRKLHWRTMLKTPYLSGDELTGETIVQIENFGTVQIYSRKERKEVDETVLYFKGTEKGMILTNRKAKGITKVLNSPYPSDWIGKKIIIFARDERHFNETFPVINVKIQKVR